MCRTVRRDCDPDNDILCLFSFGEPCLGCEYTDGITVTVSVTSTLVMGASVSVVIKGVGEGPDEWGLGEGPDGWGSVESASICCLISVNIITNKINEESQKCLTSPK